MGKSTKTYEERIQEKDLRIEKLAQELKRYETQKKQLEKRKKEEERKIRTHRLIEIGAAVESVLGRCIELEEIPKLIVFLNKQEANGKFFSKAMQKGPDTDMKKEEVGETGRACLLRAFCEAYGKHPDFSERSASHRKNPSGVLPHKNMHYGNLSLQYKNHRQERWKIGSCFFCLPLRRKAHG